MYQARSSGTLKGMSAPSEWRPKPGWYTAEDGPYLREWDGYRWTGQTMPIPVPQSAQPMAPQPRKTVTKERRQTSHTFHLLLTIFTGGAWGIFVWLPLTLWHKMGPRKKVVTHYR